MTKAETLALIRADCKADAKALDGKPLTGRVVGETFGKVFAILEALARLMEEGE